MDERDWETDPVWETVELLLLVVAVPALIVLLIYFA